MEKDDVPVYHNAILDPEVMRALLKGSYPQFDPNAGDCGFGRSGHTPIADAIQKSSLDYWNSYAARESLCALIGDKRVCLTVTNILDILRTDFGIEVLSALASRTLPEVTFVPLCEAARFNNVSAIKAFLAAGVNPNVVDKEGMTPMMILSKGIKMLTDAGATH
jgi:hypothetical protein